MIAAIPQSDAKIKILFEDEPGDGCGEDTFQVKQQRRR
jgi:hypothetical protein